MAVEEQVILSFREGDSDFEKQIARIDKRLASVEKKFDAVDDSIEEASDSAKDLSKNLGNVNKSASSLESVFKKAAKGFILAFSVQKVAQFATEIRNIATEIESVDKKTKTVFGQFSRIVTKAAKDSAKSLGLTTSEFEAAAAAAGDLLVPIGFNRDVAADLSVELVGLSGALSEWTNGQISSEQVSAILTKALLGETEQLKSLGIAINQADINTRLAEQGQEKLTGTLLKQAKAQAVLQLITEKSADAQASFASNSESLVRVQGEINASIRQTKEEIARQLIPTISNLSNEVVLPLVDRIGAVLIALTRLPQFIRENADAFKLLGVALIGLKLNSIVSTVRTLVASFVAYTSSIATATAGTTVFSRAFAFLNKTVKANPIGLAITAFTSLAGVFLLLKNRTQEATIELGKMGDELDDISASAGEIVFRQIEQSISEAKDGAVFFTEAIDGIGDQIKNLSFSQLKALKLFLENELQVAAENVRKATGVDLIDDSAENTLESIKKALSLVNTELEKVDKVINGTTDTIETFVAGSLLQLQQKFEQNKEAIEGFRNDLAGIDPNDAAGIDAIKEKIQELTKENLDLEQSIIQLSNTLLNDFVKGSLSDLEFQSEVTEDAIALLNEEINNTTNPDELVRLKEQYDKLKKSADDLKVSIAALNVENRKQLGLLENIEGVDSIKASEVKLTKENAAEQKVLNDLYKKQEEQKKEDILTEKTREQQLQENAEKSLSAINSIGQASSQAFDITSSIFQSRLAQDEELFRKGLISEKELARRKAEIAQKEAKARKAQTVLEIGLSIAQGIAAAIAASPLTGGLPFSAIVAALGAVQLGIAASAKIPPVPAFKKGVIDLKGPGTKTSDSIEARLSRGESVMTADETSQHKAALQAMRANEFDSRFLDLKNLKPADYKLIMNMAHNIKPFSTLKNEHKPIKVINKANNKDLIKNTNKNFRSQNHLLKSVKGSIDQLNENLLNQPASSYAR